MEHFSSHPRKRFTARVFVHLDASLHNHSHPPDNNACSDNFQLQFQEMLNTQPHNNFSEISDGWRSCQDADLPSCINVASIIRVQYLRHVSTDSLARGLSPAWLLENTVCLNSQYRTLPGIVTRRVEELWDETWGLRSCSASRRQSGARVTQSVASPDQVLLNRGDGYKIILNMSPLSLLHVRHNWSKTW